MNDAIGLDPAVRSEADIHTAVDSRYESPARTPRPLIKQNGDRDCTWVCRMADERKEPVDIVASECP
jgi:hypothetical protein